MVGNRYMEIRTHSVHSDSDVPFIDCGFGCGVCSVDEELMTGGFDASSAIVDV